MNERPKISFSRRKSADPGTDDVLHVIERCFDFVYDLVETNLKGPFGEIRTHYAIPAPRIPTTYLWDSAFIIGVWRMWDVDIAQQIMMPFLHNQSADGSFPQYIAFGLFANRRITKPPLMTWALTEAARMTGDYSSVQKSLRGARDFARFLYRERSKDGLFIWKHPYESGIDNSPRFTEDPSERRKLNTKNVWAIDFCVWMIVQNDRNAEIAELSGCKDEADRFREESGRLRLSINERLWDERTGYYYDYDFVKGRFIKIPTVFSLFPLYVGAVCERQADRLIEHITNPGEFNTSVPFPTVARRHTDFMKDMWRGPAWVNTSYIVIKALESYGEKKLAGVMAYRLIKGVALTYQKEGSVFEFYDPDGYSIEELTRKKGNLYKRITLGDRPLRNFVGWTGLVNTLLIENVIGYRRYNGRTIIEPNLPEDMKEIRIILSIPQFDERLELFMNDQDEITAELIHTGASDQAEKVSIYHGRNRGRLAK